jgi:hypothetical protein
MRIISCAGYYGTGSSAITDYLSQFNHCHSMTTYEFRFVQDPDGISDLEFNLVQCHNRHNSGHALKRYRKMVDYYAGSKIIKKYESFFDNQWKKISYEYIDELTDFKFRGYWYYDVKEKGNLFYFYKRLINKILKKTIWRNEKDRNLNEMPKEITLCSRPSEEKFLDCTRRYIDSLFAIPNKENKPNIIVDQIVPPSNLERFLRYFNDIKVFVVERDPRDVYLLAKYVWKIHIIPTENEIIFCKWYKYTRAHREIEIYNKEKVMFLYFEDLIYKYEETTMKIREFLGFKEENHVLSKTYLDPLKSIKNTKLWENIKGHEEEVKYIEKTLKPYIYDYKKVGLE